VPLNKSRKLSLSSNVPFVTRSSMLTLTDRQKSRSLSRMKLVPEAQSDECTCSAVRCNFLFNVCHAGSTDLLDFVHELKPTSWRQFHEVMIKETTEATVLGYGPFFPESPTIPDVVVESVDYCLSSISF